VNPRTITVDKNAAYPKAAAEMKKGIPACGGRWVGMPLFTCCGPFAMLACFTNATGWGFFISNNRPSCR
jgi:hypothetical protein